MTDSIETSESEAQPWAPAGAPAAAAPAAVARPAHLDAAPISFQEAMASMFERNVVAMAAAVIEARQHGPAEGMQWIVNTLSGPGLLPDSEWTNAQAYFDQHAPSITACAYTAPREPATKSSVKPAASINLTLRQAEALVSFFGGHDAEVTIAGGLPGQTPGLYAWLTEDPGEGSVYLGATEVDDDLAEKGRAGPAAQLDALMKLADDYAHRYSFVEDDSMPRAREALHSAMQAFLPAGVAQLQAELARLNAVINEPHTDSFLQATSIEKEHQRQRWGDAHDRDKSAEHWYWLVGYLAGKALRAAITGDQQKALHHTISSAAALANWHDAISADTTGVCLGQDSDLQKHAGQEHAGSVTLRISGDALTRRAEVLGWDDALQGLPNGEHVLYAAPSAGIAARAVTSLSVPGGAA